MTEQDAQLHQLQQQQALFTNALQAMIEGRWTGADSVEAYLFALNPTLTSANLTYDVPITESTMEDIPPKG